MWVPHIQYHATSRYAIRYVFILIMEDILIIVCASSLSCTSYPTFIVADQSSVICNLTNGVNYMYRAYA
jgi:hypothetical protein